MTPADQTPLHPWHVQNKARMGTFGGYSMPLWYPTGARAEHLAVITAAGLFDTSHMSIIRLSGPGAFDLLHYCFSADLRPGKGTGDSPPPPGKCAYGVFLDDGGRVIDDAVVYVLHADEYMVVVNAGMGPIVAGHLGNHVKERPVRIDDRTGRLAKLDLQGPLSARVLRQVLDQPGAVLERFPYFTFQGSLPGGPVVHRDVRLADGTGILLSRTGYTGEFGFELFVAPAALENLWCSLLKPAGQETVLPCGLAARDSLRAGAVLPLSHQDIGAWVFQNNPWTFALPHGPEPNTFTKPFLGADALLRARAESYTYPFAGFDLRKIDVEQARVLNRSEKEIGRVSTCVTDMAIDRHEGRIYSLAGPDKPDGHSPKGLCCGFVIVSEPLQTGETVFLVDRRRRLPAEIVAGIRPHRTARNRIEDMR
ncbi:MAG: aminomethyltransferase family protein [Thermodesulfobacteriota bacterium]